MGSSESFFESQKIKFKYVKRFSINFLNFDFCFQFGAFQERFLISGVFGDTIGYAILPLCATVLEQFHPDKALLQYGKVIKLIKENELEIRPEIYNNIGSLHIRLGNMNEAKTFLNLALDKVRSETVTGEELL